MERKIRVQEIGIVYYRKNIGPGTGIIYKYIIKLYIINKRKFKSKISDNMGNWKVKVGKVREKKKEVKKIKKKILKERKLRNTKR